jgi:hypothetical protein
MADDGEFQGELAIVGTQKVTEIENIDTKKIDTQDTQLEETPISKFRTDKEIVPKRRQKRFTLPVIIGVAIIFFGILFLFLSGVFDSKNTPELK